MNSSELRTVVGNLRKDLREGKITQSIFLQSLDDIKFSEIVDDDGNLPNLQNFVTKLLTETSR